jgi:DNA polymerase III subunit delta'
MSPPRLYGHEQAREALGRAVRNGVLPQSILLHGPAGIGKERLGLWLAQRILCEAASGTEPCFGCVSCRLVERLQHPDVHWFFPLPRPESTSAEKLRDRLEDHRATELQARRADPLHVPTYERAPAHFLASVQTLLQLAGSRPAMARRKVFVVGDAELMVPQESSPEAANAFLKLLEEPPDDTTLVITTERPGALLPTILSRVLPVRLRALPAETVAVFLNETGAADAAEAARIAGVAAGSIGRALRLRASGEGAGALEEQRRQARLLLEAALSRSAVPRLAAAHAATPSGARGEFLGLLDAFATWLRDLMAVSAGASEQVVNRDAAEFLTRAVATPFPAAVVPDALLRVDAARRLAEGNVNPQLILAELLRGVQADLAT